MTTQEAFKRRIRERMSKTGEKYGAARRALLTPRIEPSTPRRRVWVAEPQVPDESVRAATGHGWDEWADLIEAGPGREAGHPAIAAWVHEAHAVDLWWCQAVTVGYERIAGLRLPGQMPDGTFSVSRSRVVSIDSDALKALLLDDASRADLLPGFGTTLRSKPTSKWPRFGLARDGEPVGILTFTFDRTPAGRTRLVLTHEKIASPEEAELWKQYWSDWLAAAGEG
ncbi:hypothetical protein [Desertivibrio insolitus]|uniref:hypothetical protein n=1 Tax=Herbiconiux sp. SYSU D00978 TaxID=2812562 RepID=UPI001A97BFB7|nr:hypothetical protein [Herbiconiux sp. SYSU D00978]